MIVIICVAFSIALYIWTVASISYGTMYPMLGYTLGLMFILLFTIDGYIICSNKTVIYHCMRSTLITAIEYNTKTLVVPAFGGCTGAVPAELLADMMYQAYKDVVYREAHKYTNTWKNIRTKLSRDVNHLDS